MGARIKMENSYCLVFQHPVSRDVTMLPRAPRPPPSRTTKIAKKLLALFMKYWL